MCRVHRITSGEALVSAGHDVIGVDAFTDYYPRG